MSEAPVPVRPRAGPSRPARLALAVVLAVYAGVAAWLAWRTSVLEPYSDMIDWAARWMGLQSSGDYAAYLWAPHNFHHLVWTLLVLDLDIRAFGGQGYLFLAVGVACLAAVAAMMARLGSEAAGPGLRLVGGGVALALSLMGGHVLDANADINTTYLHALVFAVAAIVLAGGPAPGWGRRTAALACAAAAGLGSAAGLAVWPALAFEAWRRRSWRWLGLVLVAGAASVAVYLIGEGAGGGLATIGHGAPSPMKSVLLFINYLGLPWMRALPPFGGLIGLAVLAASLAALLFRGGRSAAPAERTAAALIVFALTTAAMAGLARTGDMAPALVPMRYAVFLIPLHVGLWVLALPYLRQAWAARPRLAEAAAFGFCAVLLAHQGVMALYALRTGDAILGAVADYRAGRSPDPVGATMYPDLAKSHAVTDALARRGLYQRELRPDPPRP